MSKVVRLKFFVTLLLFLGIFFAGTGIWLKTSAEVDPTTVVPGEEMNLVSNLYYRVVKRVNNRWTAGEAFKLGRFMGGYGVSYDYCNTYEYKPAENAFRCKHQDDPPPEPLDARRLVRATGFGILYYNAANNRVHIAVPLSIDECDPVRTKCDPYYDQLMVMPWISYKLVQGTGGHEFGQPEGIGNGNPQFGDNKRGYVSLEVHMDLEGAGTGGIGD